METYQPINKSTSSVTDAFIPCPFQKKVNTHLEQGSCRKNCESSINYFYFQYTDSAQYVKGQLGALG